MAPITRSKTGKLPSPRITIKNGRVERLSPAPTELGLGHSNSRTVTRKRSKPRLYIRNGQVVRLRDIIDQLSRNSSMGVLINESVPALTNDSVSPQPEVKIEEQSDDEEHGMLDSIPVFDETKVLDRYTFDGKPVKYENDY